MRPAACHAAARGGGVPRPRVSFANATPSPSPDGELAPAPAAAAGFACLTPGNRLTASGNDNSTPLGSSTAELRARLDAAIARSGVSANAVPQATTAEVLTAQPQPPSQPPVEEETTVQLRSQLIRCRCCWEPAKT